MSWATLGESVPGRECVGVVGNMVTLRGNVLSRGYAGTVVYMAILKESVPDR